jgi:hypothetical protein
MSSKWREMGSVIVLQDVTRVECVEEASSSETTAPTKLNYVTSLKAVIQGRDEKSPAPGSPGD